MPSEELCEISFNPSAPDRQDISPEPRMAIELLRVAAVQIPRVRRVVRFVPERIAARARARRQDRRHAVIFAWYVPPQFPELGEYYRGLLRYHHADSKLFIGMNHGSDPRWERELRRAGLDAEIRWARHGTDDYWDTTGFLTALTAYHQCQEGFSLVWFGHTKGASEPGSEIYRDQRHQHHREFWARRDEIEREFRNPVYGLFAPRFNLTPPFPWAVSHAGWNGQLDALRRVYREEYQPLGLCAYETVYVLRDTIVRQFCEAVGDAFFRTDPSEFGANKWFFEMALPSIASMQGFEPYIEMDVAGVGDQREDVTLFADVKQNHRLAHEEVARWRRDPYRFQPRVIPWDHSAWDRIRELATAGIGSTA